MRDLLNNTVQFFFYFRGLQKLAFSRMDGKFLSEQFLFLSGPIELLGIHMCMTDNP